MTRATLIILLIEKFEFYIKRLKKHLAKVQKNCNHQYYWTTIKRFTYVGAPKRRIWEHGICKLCKKEDSRPTDKWF